MGELAERVERAEFVGTAQMCESGLIRRLASSAGSDVDDAGWRAARRDYLVAARYDSHRNTAFGRRARRSRYYGATTHRYP